MPPALDLHFPVWPHAIPYLNSNLAKEAVLVVPAKKISRGTQLARLG
jgi:hypothetical protein